MSAEEFDEIELFAYPERGDEILASYIDPACEGESCLGYDGCPFCEGEGCVECDGCPLCGRHCANSCHI